MEYNHKSISLAEQIFERLENDILSGKYPRGELITELRLSEELGVSRTPIREALHRLSQEHLIEEKPKGSVVLGITRQDVRDIFKIRLKIEGMAAAECAKNITDEQLKTLGETLELQEFYISRDNVDNIRIMDSRFHEQMYLFSGSTVFYDTLFPLHRKTQKYRRTSVANHGNAEVSLLEHTKIFEAIKSHNEAAAEKAATKHIENAQKRILLKEDI